MPGFCSQTDSRLQQISRVDREPILLASSRKMAAVIPSLGKLRGPEWFNNSCYQSPHFWLFKKKLFGFYLIVNTSHTQKRRDFTLQKKIRIYHLFTNKSFFSSLGIYFCCQSLTWLRTAGLSCCSFKCLL